MVLEQACRTKEFVVRLGVLLVILSMNFTALAADKPVRFMDNRYGVDKHGEYFVQLLRIALDKSTDKYGDFALEPVAVQMRQDRQMKSLEADLLDVMWTVTSQEREKEALAVPIPLLKGLIGHRVLVINKQMQSQFAQVKSLNQLAQYTAVQGHDWPDATILEQAGLKVERIVWHDTMYKLIGSNIVDYFPRSVLEVNEEMEEAQNDALMIEPNLLIVYPSAIYFFVKKGNTTLAQRLEYGLRKAITDGSFDKLFYGFPGHVKATQEISMDNRIIFNIANSQLPKSAHLDEPELWLSSSK